MRAPPAAVCDAWGLAAPVRITGGQGTAFVAGDVVLKPVLDAVEATWLAEVLDGLAEQDDLRIIRPVRARDGRWVVDGWSGWHRLDGEVAGGRWQDVLEVSRRFHAAVADVPWSDAIARHHPWAIGDAVAWGERSIVVPTALASVVDELCRRRTLLDLPAQLVHGDLCSNVLFDERLPPAVIDVSPFWRPARYAEAIIVADSIGWFGAGADALEPLSDPEGVQLLIRAVLFRLGSAVLLCADDPSRLDGEHTAYERLVRMLFP